jgi:nitroimidazol reductase NimA-like FMN-containing flavoprotein (pyridoxamine 5'-phosphate oxidase superfamily)
MEIGRLAVTVGTAPDVFPVNYRVVDGEIVVRTDPGTKLSAATLMPSVAFEIDEIDSAGHLGWSVVVKGRGREAERLYETLELESAGPKPWVAVDRTRWLIISPREISGRRVP